MENEQDAKVRVTYLLNSGFLVQIDRDLLIFDDFKDPAGAVRRAIGAGGWEHIYFFASHVHFDHYDPGIGAFGREAERYFLSDDIRGRADTAALPQEKIVYLPIYGHWQDNAIEVTTFSSTDEGTSFLVKVRGGSIFHAGDFNWWDWLGDTKKNRQLAANGFHKQLKKLAGLHADLAFFPVDGRLGAAMDKGAREFVRVAAIGALVTMHSVGYPAWQPPADFFPTGRAVPVWSPRRPGETREFSL